MHSYLIVLEISEPFAFHAAYNRAYFGARIWCGWNMAGVLNKTVI